MRIEATRTEREPLFHSRQLRNETTALCAVVSSSHPDPLPGTPVHGALAAAQYEGAVVVVCCRSTVFPDGSLVVVVVLLWVVVVGAAGSTTVVDGGGGVSVTSFLYEKQPADPRNEVATSAATRIPALFFMLVPPSQLDARQAHSVPSKRSARFHVVSPPGARSRTKPLRKYLEASPARPRRPRSS